MTVHAPHALDIIDSVTQRLAGQYGRSIDDAIVHDIVLDSFRRYRHLDHPSSHTRSLSAQLAADRLDAVRWSTQKRMRRVPPSFLFICTGNAGRSQLAAGLMRAIAPVGSRIMSAGERPAARILPGVAEALDEIGVPIFGEYPKPVTPEMVAAADQIVVLNCDDSLDDLDGHLYRTWTVALDRTGGKHGMRATRDQIAVEVRALARDNGIEPREL